MSRAPTTQLKSELHLAAIAYAIAVEATKPVKRLPRHQHIAPDLATAERRLHNAARAFSRDDHERQQQADRTSAKLGRVR